MDNYNKAHEVKISANTVTFKDAEGKTIGMIRNAENIGKMNDIAFMKWQMDGCDGYRQVIGSLIKAHKNIMFKKNKKLYALYNIGKATQYKGIIEYYAKLIEDIEIMKAHGVEVIEYNKED